MEKPTEQNLDPITSFAPVDQTVASFSATPPPSIPILPPRSSTRPVMIVFVGIFTLAVGTFIFSLLRLSSKPPSSSEYLVVSPSPAPAKNPSNTSASSQIMYYHTSGKLQVLDSFKRTILFSDITNQHTQEFSDFLPNNYKQTLQTPDAQTLIRTDGTILETASVSNPAQFTKILDLPKPGPGQPYLRITTDSSILAYEFRINSPAGNNGFYSESNYYLLNLSGVPPQRQATIPDAPGGVFLGYDPQTQLFYATHNRLGNNTKTIVQIQPNGGVVELFTLPIDLDFTALPDLSFFYYLDNNQIKSFNTALKTLTSVYTLEPGHIQGGIKFVRITPFPNSPQLILQIQTHLGSTKKLILHTQTSQIDSWLAEPTFDEYMLPVRSPISPDGKYLFLTTDQQPVYPQNELAETEEELEAQYDYYSGKHCLIDLETHEIIPFFNCPLGNQSEPYVSKKNEDISVLWWLIPNTRSES